MPQPINGNRIAKGVLVGFGLIFFGLFINRFVTLAEARENAQKAFSGETVKIDLSAKGFWKTKTSDGSYEVFTETSNDGRLVFPSWMLVAVKTNTGKIWVKRSGFEYGQSRRYTDPWDGDEGLGTYLAGVVLPQPDPSLPPPTLPSPEDLFRRHPQLLAKNDIPTKILSLRYRPSLAELEKTLEELGFDRE